MLGPLLENVAASEPDDTIDSDMPESPQTASFRAKKRSVVRGPPAGNVSRNQLGVHLLSPRFGECKEGEECAEASVGKRL